MRRFLLLFACLFSLFAGAPAFASDAPATQPEKTAGGAATDKKAVVVRIDGEIGEPHLFILRRAVKDAINENAGVFLIDLNTPGGNVDSMLKIVEALSNFPGKTITYVNDEAISAGSFIATVTDEIWFAPRGTMGAADVVKGDGSDIGETMKLKMHSFLDAKIHALAGNKGVFRRDVQRAMMDADFELKIGDTVIKPKGVLLSLTAKEAVKTYGDPPTPLLAAGIAKNTDAVLHAVFGTEKFTVEHFENNWAETLALLIQRLAPVLLAIAGICVFIEYKTPGFGVFGITAGILFLVVFAGNYTAGLAGHEPLALLLLGVVLISVEMIFFPGTFIALSLGVLSLFAGLGWSMLDVWPQKDFEFSPETLAAPVIRFGLATLIFTVFFVLLWKFFPRRAAVKTGLVLEAVVETENISPATGADILSDKNNAGVIPNPGERGKAKTDLRPAGIVEIAGKRYTAVAVAGMVECGKNIVVVGTREHALTVEETA